MYHRIKHHLPQFLTYLGSGFTAAGCELGSYKLLLMLLGREQYLAAAVLSSFIGLFMAFVLHKYVVFKKKERVINHAIRYVILQTWNIVAQAIIVYLIVDAAGALPAVQAIFASDALVGHFMSLEMFAKIAGIGTTVSWNFFLYKFLVYI